LVSAPLFEVTHFGRRGKLFLFTKRIDFSTHIDIGTFTESFTGKGVSSFRCQVPRKMKPSVALWAMGCREEPSYSGYDGSR
tara:strand:+ start:173 stop:415 length:243 start_codon:yes stop_codon:yes gene_type:complete